MKEKALPRDRHVLRGALVKHQARELGDSEVIRNYVNEIGALVKKYAPALGATAVSSILFNTAVKFIGQAREHAARAGTFRGINSPVDEKDAEYLRGNAHLLQ